MHRLGQTRHFALWVMVGIVLVAFALRAHSLGTQASFDADDWTIITRSMHSIPEILWLAKGTPVQEIWIHLWARVAGLGFGEFATAYTSVFTGMLAVVAIYRLGRRLFDRQVALLCAFLLAVSAYHVYWSRSIRYYSWVVLLSCLAFLFLYRALTTNSTKAWAGYSLFRALSLYVHLSVLLILAAEALLVLAALSYPLLRRLLRLRRSRQDAPPRLSLARPTRPRGRRAWSALTASMAFRSLVALGLVLLLFSPRGAIMVQNMRQGTSTLEVPALSDDAAAPSEQAINRLHVSWRTPLIVLRLFDGWVSPLHALMLLGLAAGFLSCLLRRQWAQASLVAAVIVLPFAVAALIDYRKPINGRYLVSLLPLYYLMAARGVVGLSRGVARVGWLPARCRAPVMWGLCAGFLIAYAGLSAPRLALTRWNARSNWRGVGQFLAETAKGQDLVLIDGLPQHVSVMQHYLPGFRVALRDTDIPLAEYLEQEQDLWLISIIETSYEPDNDDTGELTYLELIFADSWHPDMDQATELRAAFSWDLDVAYFSRSVSSAEQLLALYESWVPKADAYHLRHHLTWARALLRLDRPDQAQAHYSQALTEGYVNDFLASHILNARGICQQKLGQAAPAFADWQEAIARAAWYREPYEQLAQAHLRSNEAQAAEEVARAAIAANPREAWPHLLLGDVHRLNGHDGPAEVEYKQAIALRPSNQAAHWHLAMVYASQEPALLALYDAAKENNPHSAWPYVQLGQIYQGLGRVPEAIAEYQRALELEPRLATTVTRYLQEADWDLATSVGLVHAYSTQGDLVWWPGDAWVKPRPFEQEVLIAHSTLPVAGQARPGQLFLHPFSAHDNTYVLFELQDIPFTCLQVGYGLADEVSGQTNGVGYSIDVKQQGDDDYSQLFLQEVTRSEWNVQSIPLTSYWGEDLSFRLTVDALGDFAFDWLQTTVGLTQLFPPAWDMSAHLAEARFEPGSLSVEWREDGFYTADGGRLVGPSLLPASQQAVPGQVHLHPYSSEIDSTILLSLTGQAYGTLKTSFALADEAAPRSNGVDYTVSVSTDGGQSFTDLLSTTVSTNLWQAEVVDLPPSEAMLLRLRSSARQDAAFDWLQVNLILLPPDPCRVGPQSAADTEVTEQGTDGH